MKEVSRLIWRRINSQVSRRVNQLPEVVSSPACKGRQARNDRTNVDGSGRRHRAPLGSAVWVPCPSSRLRRLPAAPLWIFFPPCCSLKRKATCTSAVNVSGKAICEFGFKAHPAKHNREQVEEKAQAGLVTPPPPPWTPHRRSRGDFC